MRAREHQRTTTTEQRVVADSFIYAMRGGVSCGGLGLRVGRTGSSQPGRRRVDGRRDGATTVVRNIISNNRGAGVFAGQPPCAPLSPASIDVPPCFWRTCSYVSGSVTLSRTSCNGRQHGHRDVPGRG
jgi:hypothetical protein